MYCERRPWILAHRLCCDRENVGRRRQTLTTFETAFTTFLVAHGFPATSFQVQNIRFEDKLANGYSGNGHGGARFVMTKNFLIETTEVDKLAQTARNSGDLLKVGVVFASDGGGPSLQFPGINGALLT
jgi:uncharacterized protein